MATTTATTTSTVVERKPTPPIQQNVHVDLNGDVFELPDYTMKQILDAIPPHCFNPSMLRSLGYVARDFTCVGLLGYAATHIHLIPNVYARFLAWTTYTVVQGMVGTGIWILAHECGHGAFSKSKWVNNLMGWIMHSVLLVPYHSWRISHSKHHKATGNIERDMVFIPHTRESYHAKRSKADAQFEFHELFAETPLATLWFLFVQQLFGWPAYLIANVTGQKYEVSAAKINHFYPGSDSPLFEPKDVMDIIWSDIGIAIVLAGIYLSTIYLGAWNTFVYYIIPYLFVNHWIVAITFLQHTDPSLPHYHNNVWTFPRGATATIDRDFGFIGRHMFHGIIETHVVHHLCSRIPFYYAYEATDAIKKVMGRHYRSDTETNLLVALWKVARRCKFAEESVEGSGVVFYRNLKERNVVPKEMVTGEKASE